MANGKRDIVAAKSTAVANPSERSRKESGDTRLASMPLAVLLPQLSTLSKLAEFRPSFESRLVHLQEEASRGAIAERDVELRTEAEISMLQQLLNWFSIGER